MSWELHRNSNFTWLEDLLYKVSIAVKLHELCSQDTSTKSFYLARWGVTAFTAHNNYSEYTQHCKSTFPLERTQICHYRSLLFCHFGVRRKVYLGLQGEKKKSQNILQMFICKYNIGKKFFSFFFFFWRNPSCLKNSLSNSIIYMTVQHLHCTKPFGKRWEEGRQPTLPAAGPIRRDWTGGSTVHLHPLNSSCGRQTNEQPSCFEQIHSARQRGLNILISARAAIEADRNQTLCCF